MQLYRIIFIIILWAACLADDECPDFDCPEKNGSFADPCTCRRFYQCVESFPYKNFCPSGLHFDDIKKFCDHKNKAVCGPVITTPRPSTTPPPDRSKKCNPNKCDLPYCYCSPDGTKIPDNLTLEQVPQMILLMFDGAVNLNNFPHHKKLFRGRKNPNGCDILGTFFLTHSYTNWAQVQHWHYKGHEFADGTITGDDSLYLKNESFWVNEVAGMRAIMKSQAGIPEEDILGIRAPGLKPGYNTQYNILIDYGFIWDSSIGVPPLDVPIWPYTLDYSLPHKCKTDSCPTRQFPGVWEIPLNSHHAQEYTGGHCPYLDQCVLTHMDENDVFLWLKEDFLRHYNTNRAPYTMPFHTNWFTEKNQVDALHIFIDYTLTLKDVYYVTATQALLWAIDPVPLVDLENFEAWDCTKRIVPELPCKNPKTCPLELSEEGQTSVIRYMSTCQSCPSVYPWLGNYRGIQRPKHLEEKDVYEKVTK